MVDATKKKMAETCSILISVPTNILKNFDLRVPKGERSSTIAKLMSSYSASMSSDTHAINIELLRIQRKEIQAKAVKYQTELNSLQNTIDKYYETQQEKEKQMLLVERERIEAASKCLNCGGFIDKKKSHKFPKGKVCHVCFLAMNNKDIQKWS